MQAFIIRQGDLAKKAKDDFDELFFGCCVKDGQQFDTYLKLDTDNPLPSTIMQIY